MPLSHPWYQAIKTDFQGKHILIMGLGLLGRGIGDARFFAELGCRVTCTDLKTADQLQESLTQLQDLDIHYVLGEHREKDMLAADAIIKNAGVHKNSPYLSFASEHSIPIYMDESLFAAYCPAPIIGITGTRGKTTTTHLIGEILQKAGMKIWMGGNLQGKATLPLLKEQELPDYVVLELSSWQLQGFGDQQLSPHIAVYTNLYPDHLNYYPSMELYDADKRLIYRFQTPNDHVILNENHPKTKEWQLDAPSNIHLFSEKRIPTTWKIKILGSHNRENIAAAWEAAHVLGISKELVQEVVENFSGVEHRMEQVAQIHGVTYINDTTATTPIAVEKAVNALDKPIHLIAGGADKKLDLTPLKNLFCHEKKIVHIYFLEGTGTHILLELLKDNYSTIAPYTVHNSLKGALIMARNKARSGETILLSPGCASFGMFVNEFDRGDQFKQIIKDWLT